MKESGDWRVVGHKCFEALGKAPLKGDANMSTNLFTLSDVIGWGKRHIVKLFLAASLLACYGIDQLPDDWPITYTVNGYIVMRPSEMGPLTGTVYNAMIDIIPITGEGPVQARGPGHDYGAIVNLSNPAVSVSPANAISYTVNGYTIVRPSEFGPLTQTFNKPPPPVGPGHDYGAIGQ